MEAVGFAILGAAVGAILAGSPNVGLAIIAGWFAFYGILVLRCDFAVRKNARPRR